MEELVAEFTSVLLGIHLGFPVRERTFDNHVAYLQSRVENFRDRPEAFLKAAGKAQQAFDWLVAASTAQAAVRHPEHRTYPYLLRGLVIDRPNQVWCADITYVPMRRGFLYLVAIMDWFSRKVLAWRLSNTMDVEICIEALEDAMAKHGRPDIFNTDQGSQFTSPRFTELLRNASVRLSMDGPGRWLDNVFIERLWRSLKYECVYLNAFEAGSEARLGIGRWIEYYNRHRPHSTLGGQTPDEAYVESGITRQAA